jgi:uncharacterized protein
MKKVLLEMLCCPICKEKLELQEETYEDEQIIKGNLACEKCKRTYYICNGIPQLYVTDDEIIARSQQTEFDDLVITSNRLSALVRDNVPKNKEGTLPNKKIMFFLVLSGWPLLFLSCLFLFYTTRTAGFSLCSKSVSLSVFIILISIILFVLDYIIYRIEAKDRYARQLIRLVQLNKASKLSEYDSRLEIKDKKECYGDLSIPHPKVSKILSTLKKYDFNGGKGLNIGCGGELHQLVSKPFFDQGYEMLGVDISEEYLIEYSRIFKADAILANSMALPLNNNLFDLINATDILEHLHHPFLGLCEANRVLKNGGRIILSTPYRCRFSPRCVNPLIFFEVIVSLYYDKILGARSILSKYQDVEYYHLEFSKGEITGMLESSGFEVFMFDTYFAKSKILTEIFRRLPALRFMGGSIMVIGVKAKNVLNEGEL